MKSGEKLGPYVLISKLGRGGFGEVWLAEKQTQVISINYALKLPNSEEIELSEIRAEVEIWKQASGHPNVLPIIEAEIYDGQIVIVSEYAKDGSLKHWLNNNGGKASSLEEAIKILGNILNGLQHLHSKRIVHRDLKPDNVLLQGGIPRLADFGLSKLLKASQSSSANMAGTLAYMPPEAFQGKRSFQTDIWAAGVIFYQLLSGRLPFDAPDQATLMMAILMNEPEPLRGNYPTTVNQVLNKALQKLPEYRFQSAQEMNEALGKILVLSDKNLVNIQTLLDQTETKETFVRLNTNRVKDTEIITNTVQEGTASNYFPPPTLKKNNNSTMLSNLKVSNSENRQLLLNNTKFLTTQEKILFIFTQFFFGLVIGIIARLLLPGKEAIAAGLLGWIITALLGIGGSFLGTMVGRMIWGSEKYAAGWIMSILGAVLLLVIYRIIF